MEQVVAYFDASGAAGAVGSEVEWSAFGAWAETLPADRYQQILHLWEHGWEDELGDLAEQLRDALAESPPEDPDALAAAEGMAETVEGRAEADGAVAVRLEGD